MLTCLVGGMLAIMATIVPKPLLNITRVTNESERVVKVLDIIWTDAIAYFCGTQRTGMRFQIKHKILKLNTTISKISGNLAASGWETCDLFRFGAMRKLYR